MINGMGGTPLIELYLLYNEFASVAASKGLNISRRLVGNYITSLEMQGFSITLLKVDDEMVKLWDDPVLTPGLRWGV
jgi:dihydroxyacetone kinase-like protein